MSSERRSTEWYRQVLDSMVDLVLVKGDRSKLLWANRAFLDYYGMTNEQLEDIVDSPHSDPDDTVKYVKDDHHVYTTGQVLDIPSEPITDSHGEVRYFHTVKTPVLDQGGGVVRTVGVSRLIQDSRIVQASDQEREERKQTLRELRTLVQHLPLAVAMFDLKTRFLCHSLAWRELYAYHEGPDLVGSFYDDHFADCLPLDQAITEAQEHNRAVSLTAIVMRPRKGARRIVDVEIRPWSLETGVLGGVIVLLHDITAMQAAQDALQRANEELTQFNYRVSHDLLAPLKTVRGFIDLCRDELADGNLDEVRTYHEIIHENVLRLGALVEDVLELARADVHDHEYVDIDLPALVDELSAKHAIAIADAGIALTCAHQVTRVHSARVRLLQVLDNLLSNAIKYFDPAKDARTIQVTSETDETGGLRLLVRDNGIGFDADQAESIFGIFKRATSKYPGSGLGLYIVKKHLDQLGGTVTVISNRNDTIFEVSLPNVEGETTT